MQRLFIHGAKDIRLNDLPEPVAGERDVVVRTGACGVCGTDIMAVRYGSLRPNGDPLPLGHEAAGVVESVGPLVKNIRPGMRVVLNPMAKFVEYGAAGTDVIGCGADEGAFGRAFLVRDVKLGSDLLQLPDDVPMEHAALTDPIGVAAHAIARGNAKPGDKVVIYGAGPIGLAAIAWLKRKGVTNIVSIDLLDGRLERARALGAATTINPSRENVRERLAEVHGGLTQFGMELVHTDVFIELTGSPKVIQQIIEIARPQANVVVVASHHEPVPIDFGVMLLKELNITTAVGYPTELPEVIAALRELRGELDIIISHRFPFSGVLDAFAVAGGGGSSKVLVTFENG